MPTPRRTAHALTLCILLPGLAVAQIECSHEERSIFQSYVRCANQISAGGQCPGMYELDRRLHNEISMSCITALTERYHQDPQEPQGTPPADSSCQQPPCTQER